MKHYRQTLSVILLLFTINTFAQKPTKKDYLVTIKTDQGTMHAILFDEAPKHKANFIKLAREKFYDGLLFHRVIEGFMIQGGDPNSRNAKKDDKPLGNGDNGYKIPAEFSPKLFHQKGALAAARDNNPAKESSGCQFYIVEGRKWNKADLDKQAARAARKPTEQQRKVYETIGGTPHLDGAYSVFGLVIDGLAAVDKIGMEPGDEKNRPVKDIAMKISVKKMKKKKITKKFGYQFEA